MIYYIWKLNVKQTRSLRLKDITGQRHGKLTAVAFAGRDFKTNQTAWVWKCDCGKEITWAAAPVRSGVKQSCGCFNPVLKQGDKFNLLTAIQFVSKHKKTGRSIWLWKCDCGNVVESTITSVRTGNRKSCGCQRLQKAKDHLYKISRKCEGDSCKNTLYTSYKGGAKARGLSFELTKEEFLNITTKNCSYCGKPPSNKQNVMWNSDTYVYSGIDRVDSSKGYTISNAVPCCVRCNLGKNDQSIEEFKQWIVDIYQHFVEPT